MRNPVNISETDRKEAERITAMAIDLYKKALEVGDVYNAEYLMIMYQYEHEILDKIGTGKIQDVCPPTLPGISRIPDIMKKKAFEKIRQIDHLKAQGSSESEIRLRIQQLDEISRRIV